MAAMLRHLERDDVFDEKQKANHKQTDRAITPDES
jgi:hypothetical protein